MLPPFISIRQHFPSRRLPDLRQSIIDTLNSVGTADLIKPNETVAIAAGSRGISKIDEIVRVTLEYVRSLGAKPFVVPAMGSHGGASVDGQIGVLKSLGITESTVGCPIRSSMDTVHLGETDGGVPLHFDANAASADHVVIVNRIKPHTRLTGSLQSGICKMMMIGLGKHAGAAAFHHAFDDFDYQLDRVAPQIVSRIIDKMPITLGLAIIEDAYDEVAMVEAIPADTILCREPELLPIAIEWMPQLPFDELDLLIVDQMGKEISGTGMDTNIVGRKSNDRAAMPGEKPRVRGIYVRSLTAKTAGNGTGIGIAEYCHRRVVDEMDFQKVRVNCLTSGHASAGAVPLVFESDREALEAARTQFGGSNDEIRWARILDTLHLSELTCTPAIAENIKDDQSIEIIDGPTQLSFDEDGNLPR